MRILSRFDIALANHLEDAHVSSESLEGGQLDTISRKQAVEAALEAAEKAVTRPFMAQGFLASGMRPGMAVEDLALSVSHASRS